jgi:4-hydroxybenzoate polyprenyltransferase
MHFIRLIRPVNLFIIAITMYGLGFYFDHIYGLYIDSGVWSFSFFLLVLSTVMIAAAGNIINDYFDVRADRINKPEKLIITKFIKRRVAIVAHWGINFIAFSIALFLSIKLETFWYLFIHLLSINMLWFYSMYFKRRFLIGNIVIALLTAMVPMLVGFYFKHMLEINVYNYPTIQAYPFTDIPSDYYLIFTSISLAIFAFLLNFAREIIKDIEDKEGDVLLKAKTLPLVIGEAKSKWFSSSVLLITLILIITCILLYREIGVLPLLPLYFVGFILVITLVRLINASEKLVLHQVNNTIKLAMSIGVLTPVYWEILRIYG